MYSLVSDGLKDIPYPKLCLRGEKWLAIVYRQTAKGHGKTAQNDPPVGLAHIDDVSPKVAQTRHPTIGTES